VEFSATHQGNKVFDLKATLPESTLGHVAVPLDIKTGVDTLNTPRQNPKTPGFIPKQTRYGTAFGATMIFSPWDNLTDTLTIHGEDLHYGGLLKSWKFEPALKMHTKDFKICAFKPDGWSTV